MIQIKIGNLDEFENFMVKLPRNINKELSQTNARFMRNVEKSAKRKAPVDTGRLKESINLLPVKTGKNIKKWQLIVDSPYALFQEEGFTPHVFYAGKGFSSKKLRARRGYYVSKWTPFVKPAVDGQIKTFSSKLNSAMGRALRK